MSKAHDDFTAAFDRFLDEVGVADAMSVADAYTTTVAVEGENLTIALQKAWATCRLPGGAV